MSLADKLKQLFGRALDADFYDNLEDLFIEADFGSNLAMELRDSLEAKKLKTQEEAISFIRETLQGYLKSATLQVGENLEVVMLLGVNGVGKTTSLAKMANFYKNQNLKVVAAAADTFRAAASEQLSIHAERGNFRIVASNAGGDPGAVIFDALSSAIAQKDDLLLADTAGRMHNKSELVAELRKLDKIIKAKTDGDHYTRLLVIDANTGQNALQQAEVFNEALELSGLVLTKYDSMTKGGVLVAIGKKLGLPIYFVGSGEKMTDLAPFNVEAYLDRLLG